MKKLVLMLFCFPLIGFGQLTYCDSIQINLISIDTLSNPKTIDFEVSPNYTTNYNFPYCGLFLFDNNGDTLAYQPLLSGNVYGISQGLVEIRTLEATSNFSYFFSGVLQIVNYWHSGGPTYTACSFPINFSSTELSEVLNYSDKRLIRLVDVLGREVDKKRNSPLFYIYNDGTVEKKIIIE
jgi:hypothetical protein